MSRQPELTRALVEARLGLRLAQADLADAIGISSRQLSRFEHNEREPRLSVFIAWVNALGFELELGAGALRPSTIS